MIWQHHESGSLVQREYGWTGKYGDVLGCLSHEDPPYDAVLCNFGLPRRIQFWIEALYHGLREVSANQMAVDLFKSIPVGGDLSLSHHCLAFWLLGPESPCGNQNQEEPVRGAIGDMRAIHGQIMRGDCFTKDVLIAKHKESLHWFRRLRSQECRPPLKTLFAASCAVTSLKKSVNADSEWEQRSTGESITLAASASDLEQTEAIERIALKSIEVLSVSPST